MNASAASQEFQDEGVVKDVRESPAAGKRFLIFFSLAHIVSMGLQGELARRLEQLLDSVSSSIKPLDQPVNHSVD